MSSTDEWWKRFGLLRRPPLTTHPIRPEDPGFYVEVKDPSLGKFLLRARDPVNLYGQVFAILGDYGSGKTSLLNYIQASSYSDDIFCMTLKDPPTSSNELDRWIYDGILRRLKATPRLSKSTDATNLTPSQDSISKILEELEIDKKYTGFMIFIDELHHVLDPKVVCDFLRSKQGFFEDLVSQHSAAVFVAGIPQWIEHLKQPGYQGIFDDRILMPFWARPEEAYELVYRRFKAVSSEGTFKFPFSKFSSFAKILSVRKSESTKGTPRFIIENTLKVLESPKLPPDCVDISGEMVSRLISIPKQEDIQEIERILAKEYGAIYKGLASISRESQEDREKLHAILVVLSQRPRRLNFVTTYRPHKLDVRLTHGKTFRDHNDIMNSLDDLASNKLLRVKNLEAAELQGLPADKYVELLRPELRSQQIPRAYSLREDFLKFQERIEEDFDMELPDYLEMLFESSPAVTGAVISVPEDRISKLIGDSEPYLREAEAKRRLRVALKDHAVVMERVRSQTLDSRSAVRAMYGFLKSLTLAFLIERERQSERFVRNLSDDIVRTFRELELDQSLDSVRGFIHEIELFEDRGEIDDDSWGTLQEKYTATIFPYVQAFRKFAIEGPDTFAVRQLRRTQEEMVKELASLRQELQAAYAKSPAIEERDTILSLGEIAEKFSLPSPGGGEWAQSMIEVLGTRSADKPLHYSIHSRNHQQSELRASARVTSLLYAGEAFESLIVVLGKRHRDRVVREYFRSSQQLKIVPMLEKMFGGFDKELVQSVSMLGRFDRSDSVQSFEDNMQRAFNQNRLDIGQYALATLIRNFFSHESLSWESSAVNNSEIFTRVHDAVIAAMIRLYFTLYLNESFLPPLRFQRIDLSDVSDIEKRAKVRVDNVLWGWVNEPMLKRVLSLFHQGRLSYREFDNPIPEMKFFDLIRTFAFLIKKGIVSAKSEVESWDFVLTSAGLKLQEPQAITIQPPETTRLVPSEKTIETVHEEEATPLKLTPTATRYLEDLFGIVTGDGLEKVLKSDQTTFFRYKSAMRGETLVLINGDLVLETIEKVWLRPTDRTPVNGLLVVGVWRRQEFRTFGRKLLNFNKPLSVVPLVEY